MPTSRHPTDRRPIAGRPSPRKGSPATKLADLPETIAMVRSWRYDRIIEKHQAPET
jgi:hypothetical protein